MLLKHNRPLFPSLLRSALDLIYCIATRAMTAGHGDRSRAGAFIMFVTYILSKIRAYNLYRETVRELAQLSDRELSDLGIARYDISRVARETAFA